MIPDYEISKCPELEEYFVKIYEINPYFYEHQKEKIQTNKNECEYILFRIDIYFTEYFLAVETDEKSHIDRDVTLKKKGKKCQKNKLTVDLLELVLVKKIMMYTMKLVEYRRFSVSLKTKRKKMKEKNQKT